MQILRHPADLGGLVVLERLTGHVTDPRPSSGTQRGTNQRGSMPAARLTFRRTRARSRDGSHECPHVRVLLAGNLEVLFWRQSHDRCGYFLKSTKEHGFHFIWLAGLPQA